MNGFFSLKSMEGKSQATNENLDEQEPTREMAFPSGLELVSHGESSPKVFVEAGLTHHISV